MKMLTFQQYKKIRNLSLNEFNRWVVSIYKSGFEDGLKEGEKEFDECSTYTEDELMDLLLSLHGIGKKTAEKIVDAIIDEVGR